MNSPSSVSLAGIDNYLQDLRHLVDSIPSMIDQTSHEYLQIEMEKLAIQSQEILATLANNSIGFRAPPTPTEEFDPVLHL